MADDDFDGDEVADDFDDVDDDDNIELEPQEEDGENIELIAAGEATGGVQRSKRITTRRSSSIVKNRGCQLER